MKNKKVVVLGFPFERQVELEGALNYDEQEGKKCRNCKVVFAGGVNHALSEAKSADVVVANTEECGDFFPRLFEDGYRGDIVPFASSRSQMSKGVALPSGKLVFPTNYHGVKGVVLSKLDKLATKASPRQESAFAT